MLSTILGWLGSKGLSTIGDQLNKAYEAKLKAQNDHEKLEAEKRIAQLSAQQAVLIAEQGNWLTRWIRPAIAAPFVLFIWKVIVWDNMLGLGVTDPLSDRMAEIMMVVLGAYFLTRPIEKIIKRRN